MCCFIFQILHYSNLPQNLVSIDRQLYFRNQSIWRKTNVFMVYITTGIIINRSITKVWWRWWNTTNSLWTSCARSVISQLLCDIRVCTKYSTVMTPRMVFTNWEKCLIKDHSDNHCSFAQIWKNLNKICIYIFRFTLYYLGLQVPKL